MKRIKILAISLVLALLWSVGTSVAFSGAYYLPDVTKEMSSPDYWTRDDEILMSLQEIEALNQKTISQKSTVMYDLKNQPEMVDGIALNEAIKKSSTADATYYLGWTYLQSSEKATMEDYEKIIENTQNPNAQKNQSVLYAVATERTELRTFPSDVPIWDDPADYDFDYEYLSSVRVNEPLVITSVSKDEKYYLAKNVCCSGWVRADSVAICKDKEQWLSSWDIDSEDALVVWGDKVFTEASNMGKDTSELMLTMGTVLKLAKDINPSELIDNRAPYNNYAVWMPRRAEDGTLDPKLTLISENENVSVGYLPLTKKNISRVVFSALGNTYGWGGSLKSDDCSGYMRNVYKCFGLELARNTSWQSQMPMGKVDMQYMCKEERLKLLDALPFGTILYFNGHEMMYLGSQDGKYYVISSVSTIMNPQNSSVRQRIRGTIVNTLDVKRANGNTWLDELNLALVPYYAQDSSLLPNYEWYHDGVAFCLKNKLMQGDENKFFRPSSNITWAELLQIVFNMEGAGANATADSEIENWYDLAVDWAKENGLVYENDMSFDPNSAINRQQLVSVLYLYSKYKGYDVSEGEDTNLLSYDDVSLIADYAIPAMQFATSVKLINGKTETTLNPCDNTTRAEVAVILERFSGFAEKEKERQKTVVNYNQNMYNWMHQVESDNEAVKAFETIDTVTYGSAGSSISQTLATRELLALTKKDGIEDAIIQYISTMDATKLDYFSFQWQMRVKHAKEILTSPESFLEEWKSLDLDEKELMSYDIDALNKLDALVLEKLSEKGVGDEWKNHMDKEPFYMWQE